MSNLASFMQGFILGLAMFIAPGPKDVLILRATLAGAGAVLASLAWFALWILGAGSFRRWMRAAIAWRLLDALIAIAMIAMAAFIAAELLRPEDDAPGHAAGAQVGERGIGR
jgi:arginine exporter protein ArgO